jgi:hypothetical protein
MFWRHHSYTCYLFCFVFHILKTKKSSGNLRRLQLSEGNIFDHGAKPITSELDCLKIRFLHSKCIDYITCMSNISAYPLRFPGDFFLFEMWNTKRNRTHMNDVKNRNIQNQIPLRILTSIWFWVMSIKRFKNIMQFNSCMYCKYLGWKYILREYDSYGNKVCEDFKGGIQN